MLGKTTYFSKRSLRFCFIFSFLLFAFSPQALAESDEGEHSSGFVNGARFQDKPFKLTFPVACHVTQDCYIQHYVSHKDPVDDTASTDFMGGALSYGDHNGTDIALPDYHAIQVGYAVQAAEAGTVLRTRDGVADNHDRQYELDESKACGNGIVISHQAGYTTQYCHLKENSVKVKPGEHVTKGQVIAAVGSSGEADFPHLHFTVRQYGEIVDPFAVNLWEKTVPYKAVGLIDQGVTNKVPALETVLQAGPKQKKFRKQDKYVIAWFRVYGVKAGDEEKIIFYQPNGQEFHQPIQNTIKEDYIQWYSYAGFPLKKDNLWQQKGTWKIVYLHRAPGKEWQRLGMQEFVMQ